MILKSIAHTTVSALTTALLIHQKVLDVTGYNRFTYTLATKLVNVAVPWVPFPTYEQANQDMEHDMEIASKLVHALIDEDKGTAEACIKKYVDFHTERMEPVLASFNSKKGQQWVELMTKRAARYQELQASGGLAKVRAVIEEVRRGLEFRTTLASNASSN